MGEKTVTEYKTVEEEKSVIVCDSCGATEEESKGIVPFMANPHIRDIGKISHDGKVDYCVECYTSEFDVELNEKDLSNVSDVSTDHRELEITYEEKAFFSSFEYADKNYTILSAIFSPIGLVGAAIGEGVNWNEQETPTETFVYGFLGGTIWVTLAFVLALAFGVI